jgi:hypothetical protein
MDKDTGVILQMQAMKPFFQTEMHARGENRGKNAPTACGCGGVSLLFLRMAVYKSVGRCAYLIRTLPFWLLMYTVPGTGWTTQRPKRS